MISRFSILFFLLILLFSCAEENTSEDESSSSSSDTGVEFYNKEFQVESNIGASKYLIKVPSNSQSANVSTNSIVNTLSNDSQSGFVYALNSSDQIISLFTPFDSGELKDISKKGNSSIMVGEFTKDNITCLVLVSGDLSSTCLVAKQSLISSVGAAFIEDESQIALLIDNSNTGKKELYLYNSNDGFISVNSINSRSIQPLEFNLTGSIVDSYSSNDYAAFYVKNGNDGELLFVKSDGSTETKTESVTSDSVQDVSGEPLFMSNGNLRQGWSNSIYYKESSNNRTISDSGILVSHKDAFFQIYYQSDYTTLNKAQELAYNNPMLFYLKPKRKDLPTSYPSFTLEPINCCSIKHSNGSISDGLNEIDWKKASGYKQYALAYGENVTSSHYEFDSSRKSIEKAIILIDANAVQYIPEVNTPSNLNPAMPNKLLYDETNPTANNDNLIKPLSYDTVSNIETYKNGFKITGTWALNSSDQRIVFYNPSTNAIETPSTSDQQTFVIKERL